MNKILPGKRILKKTLKIFFGIIGGLALLFIIVSLSLLIPSVQTFVVDKATDILSKRAQSRVEVGGVHIAFPKTVRLSEIFAEDNSGDTLIYCREINIDVALLPLIRKKVQIDHLKIAGLKANVIRTAGDSVYNYVKILEAFSIGQKVEKEEKNNSLWDLGFEDIELENIVADFSDYVDSTFLHLDLGHFLVNARITDVQSMIFDLDNINISNANFTMALPDQKKQSIPENDQQKTSFPEISVTSLIAADISYKLTIGQDNLALEAVLKEAEIRPDVIDLNQGDIFIHDVRIDGAVISYRMDMAETQPEDTSLTISDFTFGNFEWDILVKHADIRNTAYKMDLNHKPRLPYGMDYMHMDFSDFNMSADSIFMNKNHTGANVREFSLKEVSAPAVKNISGVFFMDNQHITAKNIDLTTENSHISGSIKLSYPALYLIGSELKQLGIASELAGTIDLSEARPFTAMIDSIVYLKNIGSITINNLSTSGTLADFTINVLDATLGDSTKIKLQSHVAGLPTSDLDISYVLDTLMTNRSDLMALLPEGTIPDNIQLPYYIGIMSKGETDMKNGTFMAELVADSGKAGFNFTLKNEQFESTITVDNLDAGAILNDTIFGVISLRNHTEGKMVDFIPQEFESLTEILEAEWNKVLFENYAVEVRLADDVYSFSMDIADSAINAGLRGKFYQKGDVSHFLGNIDISSLNLERLNLMDEFFMVSGQLKITFDGMSQIEYQGTALFEDIRLYRPENSFLIKQLSLEINTDEKNNDFHLNSDILDASLTGNTKPGELYDALIDHIDLYLELPDSIVSEKDFVFEFDLNMKNPAFFTDFLIDDLIAFELDTCHVSYHDANDILTAHVSMPVLQYKNLLVENLTIDFDTKTDSAVAAFGISKLLLNSISITKLGVQSVFTKNLAKTKIYLFDNADSLKYQVQYDIAFADSVYYVAIDPASVFMNYENWTVHNENMLVLKEDGISATSALIEKNGQKIGLKTQDQILSLDFENFAIANFSEILVADSSTEKWSGMLNGFIDFENILSKSPAIRSELHIAELHTGTSLLGDFKSAVEYQPGKPFKFDFDLQNKVNTLHAAGLANFTEDKENISAVLEMNITEAEAFLPIFSDYLGHLKGGIRGRIAITGKPESPSFNGSFDLRALDVMVTQTNTRLLTNGKLLFDNNILSFNAFTFQDHLKNTLDIRGNVDYSNFRNPVFDLQAITGDFLVINTVPQKTEALEGKLHLGLDLKVTGPMSKLKVVNNIKINEGTDIYYTMPGNELELITDEGVVEYVDFENPEMEVMLQEKQTQLDDSIISLIKGLDFTTNLMIDPKAKFSLIVDPESGDYSEFFMNGSLQYTYTDVQGGHLSGLLEFEKGFYELSFYGLVKKRFDFQPGSIVSWSGDIMDGDLNFRAKYTVRTNSVGLVSNEISSYERALYNQRLPYDVILKIENKISDPVISFGIDLPARYRSSYQTLDAKLNYMNQPSMEAERNKQVFALLVGGTFIPEDPGITEGAEGSNFATTAARNSVNAIMTQQLNNLTGKFIEGLDVDMGLNTFDDYASGSAQTKTQLDLKVSKNLFNDRVTAEMESHINLDGSTQQMGTQSTAGMTEFAVSYMITKSGNYRIKAFSENSFDIFDGEIQNSGIAFIFIKEFDSFRKKQDNPNVDPGFKEEEEDEEDKDR